MLYMGPFVRLARENVRVLEQYCWFVSELESTSLTFSGFWFELWFALL